MNEWITPKRDCSLAIAGRISVFALLVLGLAGCGPAPVQVTATPTTTLTPSPLPPTLTSTSTPKPTDTPTPTPAPTLMGAGSHMAFASNRDGNWEIYYMRLGEEPVRLTDSPDTDDFFPELSPAGGLLLYWSVTKGSSYSALNWMRLKNGSVTRSGEFAAGGGPDAAFSPDGKLVAMTFTLGEGDTMLLVGSVDGGAFREVEKSSYTNHNPAWSPYGKTIAVASDRDKGRSHIYLMNVEGTNVRRLTSGDMNEVEPAWSPNGKTMAFVVLEDEDTSNIYLANADGTNVRKLTNETGTYNENPVWSPDGSLIAFWSDRTGNHEIFYIRPDGTGLTNLTNNPAEDENPTWVR